MVGAAERAARRPPLSNASRCELRLLSLARERDEAELLPTGDRVVFREVFARRFGFGQSVFRFFFLGKRKSAFGFRGGFFGKRKSAFRFRFGLFGRCLGEFAFTREYRGFFAGYFGLRPELHGFGDLLSMSERGELEALRRQWRPSALAPDFCLLHELASTYSPGRPGFARFRLDLRRINCLPTPASLSARAGLCLCLADDIEPPPPAWFYDG